jgi:A/G-specific adenine glycosylase
VQQALLTWSARERRDLPWRRTRDAWAVLVSEMMLQQTQVARVVPRYHAFLARFPTPDVCARAARADVIREWNGLGYNRRAVHLHDAARAIVDRHGGELPDDIDALRALPGVGAYTARAILAFAFERPVGVVEVNSARVLARAFSGRRLTAREAQDLADAVVPAGRAWDWNQAMLDLGATICTKRTPRCEGCPIRVSCAWARRQRSMPDPAVGTAGSGGHQSAFAGSDREGRGRLVSALRRAPVSLADAAAVSGWPDDPPRVGRVLDGLVEDGLVMVTDGMLTLAPG